MKRKFLITSVVMVAIIICFSSSIPSYFASSPDESTNPVNISDNFGADSEKILEARFLNMLNHNYVYNSDFDNVDQIVNNSVISVLNCRDKQDTDFIAENYVSDFVYNMYGIKIEDTASLNNQYPQKDGYIFIIPRGYTKYSHSIDTVSLNEDGSYTVTTSVKVMPHDGSLVELKAVSLFVKNSESSFGYNIIYSDILENAANL